MAILKRLLCYGPQFCGPDPGFEGLRVNFLTITLRHRVSNAVGPYEVHFLRKSMPKQIFVHMLLFMDREARGFLSGRITELKVVCKSVGESSLPPFTTKENGDVRRDGKREWWGYDWVTDLDSLRSDKD